MRDSHAEIGPCPVPTYPVKAWTATNVDAHEVWKLCGPTVNLLMDKQPLWLVFVSVYLEGLNHGAGAQRGMVKESGDA